MVKEQAEISDNKLRIRKNEIEAEKLSKPEPEPERKPTKEELERIKSITLKEKLKMLDEYHTELLKKAKDGLIDKDEILYLMEDRKRDLGLLKYNI